MLAADNYQVLTGEVMIRTFGCQSLTIADPSSAEQCGVKKKKSAGQ